MIYLPSHVGGALLQKPDVDALALRSQVILFSPIMSYPGSQEKVHDAPYARPWGQDMVFIFRGHWTEGHVVSENIPAAVT